MNFKIIIWSGVLVVILWMKINEVSNSFRMPVSVVFLISMKIDELKKQCGSQYGNVSSHGWNNDFFENLLWKCV